MNPVQARTRITLKNILFATDFSPAADLAAPIAVQLAQRYGAKVYGVHVNRFDDYTAAASNAWAAMAETAERETKEQARRLNKQLEGVEHETVIGEGNIREVMFDVIEKKEIDLVVLGTRGRTGFGKALLGSVAEQTLRQFPNGEKTRPSYCPEQQLFARRPSMINQARRSFVRGDSRHP
jgi:nucleotide-binding universal stress UspA family protein